MGELTLAMQFEDSLFTVSLKTPSKWTIWSGPKKMIKLNLIRGYDNNVYYAEKGDTGDRVCKL